MQVHCNINTARAHAVFENSEWVALGKVQNHWVSLGIVQNHWVSLGIVQHHLVSLGVVQMAERCFTSTETVGLLGTGAQDGHLAFHTAPDLWQGSAESLRTVYAHWV